MIKHIVGGLPLYRFQNLSRFPELVHFVTTRDGGVSQNGDTSFNLGFHDSDSVSNVLENRSRLANALDLTLDNFTHQVQVHSATVTVVDENHRGMGSRSQDEAIQHNDGLVTATKDICLMTKSADCVPILLYDPVAHVVAALHAGWKGMVQNIAANGVAKMVELGSNPKNIVAGIGPSNGPCCYEVGADVEEAVFAHFGTLEGLLVEGKGVRRHLDQWEANRRQLVSAGLKPENVEVARVCSQCNCHEFFSARMKHTGRFAAGIMLKY